MPTLNVGEILQLSDVICTETYLLSKVVDANLFRFHVKVKRHVDHLGSRLQRFHKHLPILLQSTGHRLNDRRTIVAEVKQPLCDRHNSFHIHINILKMLP